VAWHEEAGECAKGPSVATKPPAPQPGAWRAAPIGQADSAAPAQWRRWEWQKALLDALARHEINPTAFAVGIALSLFADNRTGESRPSVKAIAERVGAAIYKGNDSRTVRDALGALERYGLLEIRRRGHMKPNLYLPRYPLREIGAESGAHDRQATADMIGEPPPTNSSNELSNLHHPPPPLPPHRLLTTSPPGHATSEDISPAHSWPKFEEFLSAYPFDQTMAVDRAKGEFERLSIEERLKAVRCAKLYRSALEKRGPSVCALNATTWPERRKWLEAELVETLASARGETVSFVVRELVRRAASDIRHVGVPQIIDGAPIGVSPVNAENFR
jgi:hypothetical protein